MTRSEIVQRFRWQFQFFWFTFEKIHKTCIFSKVNQKNLATKKLKLPSESLENCTTSDAGILNSHFSLLFLKKLKNTKKQEEKNKKI